MANELRHSDVGTALSKSEWEATGGHIFNSQAAGDIMYASTTSQLTRLGIGTANQVLATNSGATAPEWVTSVASATLAATVTVIDSTDTSSYIAMFDSATGSLAAKTDAGITYNAGTGMLTATGFTGPLTGTLVTAAQGNVTSLGTLTALTVDNVSINGATIGHTSDTDLMTLADGVLTVAGEIDGTTLDISGNADIDGTLEADAYTVDSVALNEYIADTVGAMVGSNTESGITVAYQDGDNTLDFTVGTLNQDTTGTAAIATTVTITDNESTDEDNAIIFTAGGDVDGGNIGLESDGTLTYNPSTGKVTATGFIGALTGNVTGDTSGSAATVTTAAQSAITSLGTLTTLTVDNIIINGTNIGHTSDTDSIAIASDGVVTMNQIPVFSAGINVSGGTIAGTLATAAQGSVTSLGTLTALTVDDVAINGKVITMTGDTSDTTVITAGSAGTLSIVTTDAAGADADIQITADGSVDIDSAGILTLDSGAAINIEPASGSAILLDGTISIDAGVVTGASSITSTAFVGALTGNASGTAATVTGAAQSNITSLGTLTTLTVDNVITNGTTIGHTDDTDLMTLADGVLTVTGNLDVSGSLEVPTIDFTDGDNAITIADTGITTFPQQATFSKGIVVTAADSAADDGISTATGTGLIATMRAVTGIGIGELVHIDANGDLDEAHADATADMPAIGIALTANTSGSDANIQVLLQGFYRDDSQFSFGTMGAPVYTDHSTEGDFTLTPSTTDGHFIQRVGISVTDDMIYFNPSLDVIERD